MLESQAGYVGQAVELLAAAHLDTLEVRPEAAERSTGRCRSAGDSVGPQCHSWYRDEAGRITNNWPGTVREYRERTATFEPADYVPA